MDVKDVIDPRVDLDQEITYFRYIGAQNWETYSIPASGLSNSLITFANLTTLGENRIYEDKFMISYTAEIIINGDAGAGNLMFYHARPSFAFKPFALQQCCSQIAVNINGKRCSSIPNVTIPARMQYWPQALMNNMQGTKMARKKCHYQPCSSFYSFHSGNPFSLPSDYSDNTPSNIDIDDINITVNTQNQLKMTVKFIEPLLCSPFNQNLFKQYGYPLWNISTLDIQLWLENLPKMLLTDVTNNSNITITNVNVNLTEAKLLYKVASLRSNPPSTYITQNTEYVPYKTTIGPKAVGDTGNITSGVYTLSYVPQSILVFIAPDTTEFSDNIKAMEYNDLFQNINHINITMGNNTQLLNTYTEDDLYRACKFNGLADCDFIEWGNKIGPTGTGALGRFGRIGTCLRLTPGSDIVLPDQELIPGSSADKLVFQISCDYNIIEPTRAFNYCLYIVFEYIGSIIITPGNAEIDMIPLKNNTIATTISTSQPAITPGEPTGEGFRDFLKKAWGFGKKNLGNIVNVAKGIATQNPLAIAQGVGGIAGNVFGKNDGTIDTGGALEINSKKRRLYGGELMGGGDWCD